MHGSVRHRSFEAGGVFAWEKVSESVSEVFIALTLGFLLVYLCASPVHDTCRSLFAY